MQNVAGFPYSEVQFNKDGEPDASDRSRLSTELSELNPTDLLVISHGWRNNVDFARALYRDLLGSMRARLDAGHPAGAARRFAVAGVLWPSLKFAEQGELPQASAGGGASLGGDMDVPSNVLDDRLNELGIFLDKQDSPELARAREAAGRLGAGALGDGSDPRKVLVESLQALLPPASDTKDDASDQLFAASWEALFDSLKEPVSIIDTDDGGGAASMGLAGAPAAADPQGEAAGLGSLFGGVKAAAFRILNYATYYVMKERAGKVGNGLNDVLADLRAKHPELRIHLVGHSFGARLVTAAAAGARPFAPASLSLLQAAYSHNALGPGRQTDHVPEGFFRRIVTEHRVNGPIIATHTQNDKAVGVAYAIASRLSGDRAAAFGGPEDVFGGIGRNGAVRMNPGETQAETLQSETFDYPQWAAGTIYNLRADRFISGHGDVTNPAVANAVLNALRS